MLPWASFHGFNLNLQKGYNFLLPIFTMGKYHEEGGKLLFCGTDKDPYQDVLEWWNSEGNSYSAPSEHLFSLLGMPEDPDSGEYTCGKGQVTVIRTDPKDFVLTPDSDSAYIEAVKKLYESGDDRLVFKNTKGFAIGFNLILVPASTSSLGRGPASGKNYTITKDSDRKLFLRAAVNNAAYDYISRCSADDMNLTLPPGDLRIWLMSSLSASSAVMIHHKVAVSHPLISDFLGVFASIIAFFAPDVTVGTADMDDYDDVYRAVCHELAHCSHFSQVGKDYWNRYVEYILRSYLKSGGSAYGDGTGEYAGYCEIGEMWAYYLESVMYQERYGGSLPQFGTGYWFSPQIFRYLDDRGFSRSDFLAAMKSDVTSIDLLRDKLTASFPDKGEMINQVFLRYN